MKVLFAVCSWGLGHATRDLPFIRELLLQGHAVDVVGTGRSLHLLKNELGDACGFYEIADYSSPYGTKDFSVTRLVSNFPFYVTEIMSEHAKVGGLIERGGYDRIVSDNRFGVYHESIPSFFFSHQLRFIAPHRVVLFERVTEAFNYLFKNRFVRYLVPDLEENSLSGELCHHLRYFKRERIVYLGIPAIMTRRTTDSPIDYFISISGPEPQRTILERKVLSQVNRLPGRVVVTLGKPEDGDHKLGSRIQVYGHLNRARQEEMMNRSHLVVARPGYTTLMEVALLGKQALFIPTPGQTEQEYLARYHTSRGTYFSVAQDDFELCRDVETALGFPGIHLDTSGPRAEDRFMDIVRE